MTDLAPIYITIRGLDEFWRCPYCHGENLDSHFATMLVCGHCERAWKRAGPGWHWNRFRRSRIDLLMGVD